MEEFTPKNISLKWLFITVFSFVFIHQLNAQGAGQALYFDGSNDYINLNDLSDDLAGGDFTMEAWVKAEDDNQGLFTINTSSGGNKLMAYRNKMWYNSSAPAYSSPIQDDAWHHFALVIDANSFIKVYIDGVQVENKSISFSLSSNDRISFGQEWDGSSASQHLKGGVDEIRIWSDVRTQQEIRDNMCLKLAGNESDLLTYYRCDEESSSSLTDVTSTQDATLVGSPAFMISSAPIGNAVDYSYAVSTSTSLNLAHGNGDDLTAEVSAITSASSLFLYRIDMAPNFIYVASGLEQVSNEGYWGVWSPDGADLDVNVVYDHSGHPNTSTPANLELCYRQDAGQKQWL
ncbi:MAG: LamG domain-containing protein, partial [Bacteroidia bacterium]